MQPGVEESTDAAVEPPTERWAWRQRLRARPHTRLTLRIVVGTLGTLLILAGFVTGPLPGPGGIPLVLLGLAVWSSEFAWAHRLMGRFRLLLRRLRSWPRRRKVVAVVAAVVLGWSALYASLWFNGVPGWLPEAVRTLLLQLPGLSTTGSWG